jgi:hypothetical protein
MHKNLPLIHEPKLILRGVKILKNLSLNMNQNARAHYTHLIGSYGIFVNPFRGEFLRNPSNSALLINSIFLTR